MRGKKAIFGKITDFVVPIVAAAIILIAVLGPENLFAKVVEIGDSMIYSKLPDERLENLENIHKTLKTLGLAQSYNALATALEKDVKPDNVCRIIFNPKIPKDMKKGEHIRLVQKYTDKKRIPYIEMYIINDRQQQILEERIDNRKLCAVAGKATGGKWASENFYDVIFNPFVSGAGIFDQHPMYVEENYWENRRITKSSTYNEYSMIEIKEGNPNIVLTDANGVSEGHELEAPFVLYFADEITVNEGDKDNEYSYRHVCFIPTKDGNAKFLPFNLIDDCDGNKVLDDDCLLDPKEHGLTTENSWLDDCKLNQEDKGD